MAYNPALFFPQTYQYPFQPQAVTQPQLMTPPTIRAEIIQVDGEEAAAAFPVGAGASQMMIAKDDSAIFIKTATTSGQIRLDVYVRRPPASPVAAINPSEYVRRDEIAALVEAAVAAQKGGAEE